MLCTTLAAALETLGKQTETVAIPPQQLDDVASASAKHEHMSGERLLMQNVLHLRTQPIKSAAQVRHSGRNPDLGPNRKLDHWTRLSSRVRSNVGSAPLSTLITARPGSSMWIAPPAAGTTTSGARFSSSEFDTLTGRGLVFFPLLPGLAALNLCCQRAGPHRTDFEGQCRCLNDLAQPILILEPDPTTVKPSRIPNTASRIDDVSTRTDRNPFILRIGLPRKGFTSNLIFLRR